MNLFKNPFHILGATPRDDRYRIIELADERSLLSDADECTEARDILINPRRRVSAEVAWLPGIDPSFYGLLFRYLESPNEEFPSITMIPIASANLRATKLSKHPGLSSSDLVEWILTIAQISETINSETVRATLNADRSVSGFPEITDPSAINDEIRNQKRFYSDTVTSVLENLSVNARVRVMMSLIETATSNGRNQCPIVIRDLIPPYQHSVLEPKKRIIEAQVEQLRAMADAEQPDTILSPIVDQLLETLREWDILARPIYLVRQSTGQRDDAISEIALRFRQLAADLFQEYSKPNFSRRILNTSRNVFSEAPEIVEQIDDDLRALEEQERFAESVREFENIKTQAEQLKAASDAGESDSVLSSMVNRLIQSIRSWDPTTKPIEANQAVVNIGRGIALHLWNKHRKLDFAIQITNALIDVLNTSSVGVEVMTRLNEDLATFVRMKISAHANNLIEAADLRRPHYTLTPMVNQLIETVKTWAPSTQPVEKNNEVANIGRGTAHHLWSKHRKRDFAIRITRALIDVFEGVYGMDEVNNRLREDLRTLENSGCIGWLTERIITYAVVFGIMGIIALIGSLMEGC